MEKNEFGKKKKIKSKLSVSVTDKNLWGKLKQTCILSTLRTAEQWDSEFAVLTSDPCIMTDSMKIMFLHSSFYGVVYPFLGKMNVVLTSDPYIRTDCMQTLFMHSPFHGVVDQYTHFLGRWITVQAFPFLWGSRPVHPFLGKTNHVHEQSHSTFKVWPSACCISASPNHNMAANAWDF